MFILKKTFNKKIKALEDGIQTQIADGTWNYDQYMHGMANGLILALSIMTNKEPNFLNTPEVWLKDLLNTETTVKESESLEKLIVNQKGKGV